ncbi:MAG: SurA N-terminal domain-containing protein [Acidobacteria bacterium]|nr:SurA N-terminal domain-containing protein [Acidobacteriota bacterium]
MKLSIISAGLLCALLVCQPPVRAGEVLDRIVATVNKQIILQSDWDNAVRYEAFMDGRPAGELGPDDRRAVLNRLIDQELLQEQMPPDAAHAGEAAIAKRMQAIRQQYPQATTAEGWNEVLQQYGIAEKELRDYVALQLDLLRLVDEHLRPTVQVDAKSIESYYNQQLLPELRKSGAKEPALSEASSRIKELLTQQQVNQLLTSWLQSLRTSSTIRTDLPHADSQDRAQ